MDTSKPVTPDAVIAAQPGDLTTMSTHHLLALYRNWRPFYDYHEGGEPKSAREISLERAREILKAELDRRPNVEYGRQASKNRRRAAQRGI